jgi:hypothetical protein
MPFTLPVSSLFSYPSSWSRYLALDTALTAVVAVRHGRTPPEFELALLLPQAMRLRRPRLTVRACAVNRKPHR